MVFQKPNPFPAMSIYDNVASGLKLAGIKVPNKDAVVEASLRRAGLWNEVHRRLRAPGGGALRRPAAAAVHRPRPGGRRPTVLLMDEPCSALDPTSTRRIEETIAELENQVTIVIVTHNMQQAQRVSHNCAFFLAAEDTPGHIVECGADRADVRQPRRPADRRLRPRPLRLTPHRPAGIGQVTAAKRGLVRLPSSGLGWASGTTVAPGGDTFMTTITVTVDGVTYTDDVEPRLLLVHYLRERVGKTGTPIGCDTSNCGACTVHLNGVSVKSCSVLAVQADGAQITTIEGMANGEWHPLQQAFHTEHALQCGYCTPGMIMAAADLLRTNPHPSDTEIREGLEGNLCRCTGYENIVRAVRRAAEGATP